MKKRIVLILPYFGNFPNYFNLWIYTAAANKMIDYLIITDQEFDIQLPENIVIKNLTFEAVQKLVQDKFDFKIKLKNPYKLCDYRPAYGIIFAEYIYKYEFWGHCDPDIIWGDISSFLTNDILDKYDRIYERGHLCLYRNTPEINKLFLNKAEGYGITYQDVYQTNYSCHFDEGQIIGNIFADAGKRAYQNIDCADVLCNWFEFRITKEEKYKQNKYIFRYSNGKLCGFYLEGEQIKEEEFCYLHLQKRKMKVTVSEMNFWIVPNEFVDCFGGVDKEFIKIHIKRNKMYEFNYWKMIYRMKVKNVFEGALLYRMKNKINKKQRFLR